MLRGSREGLPFGTGPPSEAFSAHSRGKATAPSRPGPRSAAADGMGMTGFVPAWQPWGEPAALRSLLLALISGVHVIRYADGG